MNIKRVVYLDNCCNSRLFDGDTSPKVEAQAAKIRRIIDNRKKDGYVIIGGFAGEAEIRKIPDDEKRRTAEQSYRESIDDNIKLSAQIITRAVSLNLMGMGKMDSFHLAAAEAAGADILITTDEKFIRKCKNRNITTVKVIDPLDF
jgi:predicted nucleic acid-binding protein